MNFDKFAIVCCLTDNKRPIQAHIYRVSYDKQLMHKSCTNNHEKLGIIQTTIANKNGLYKLTFSFTKVKFKKLNQLNMFNDCK